MRVRSLVLLTALFGCGGASPPADVAPPNPRADAPTAAPASTASAPSDPEGLASPPMASATPPSTPSATPPSTPSAAPSVARSDPPAGTPGANLVVSAMNVNGLQVSTLSCRLDDVGIMTAALLIGGLAKQKGALKACGADQPKVEWSVAHGRVKDVKVTAKSAAIEKCVARAIASAQLPVEGTCSAVLLLDR